MEEPVKLDDVRMVQNGLNFDLSDDLTEYILFLYERLLEGLEGTQETGFLVFDHGNNPVFSFAYFTNHFKIFESEFPHTCSGQLQWVHYWLLSLSIVPVYSLAPGEVAFASPWRGYVGNGSWS